MTNSVDLDELQHYAAFHLGFHCLQNDSFMGFLNTKSLKNLYVTTKFEFSPATIFFRVLLVKSQSFLFSFCL